MSRFSRKANCAGSPAGHPGWNFIVTEGEDALALAEEIRERVKREHGVELEYEVELWRANEPSNKSDIDEANVESNRKEST